MRTFLPALYSASAEWLRASVVALCGIALAAAGPILPL